MKEIIEKLTNIFSEGDIIVVGCSGGPDSMCLLNLLLNVEKKIKIICANVDHNLREESSSESFFVESFCKKNNLIYEKVTIADSKNNNEALLREKRYDFFDQLMNKYKSKYLLTAHHGDDLIETILMRIVRGSNLKGYSGFDYLAKKGKYTIIKPLIYTTKDEIIKYLKANNIDYVEDSSNLNDKYTRNRFRHNILPFLKKEEPNINQKFLDFSQKLNQYHQFVDKIVDRQMKTIAKDNKYNIETFATLDELIQIKVIERILSLIYQNDIYLLNDKHIESIRKMIIQGKANDQVYLPNNIKLIKEYNNLIVEKAVLSSEEYTYILEKEVILPNTKKIVIVASSDLTDNNCIRLDSQEIGLPLHVRSKKDGDYLIVKNMTGKKKLKDIFIECKIPMKERKEWPVVVDSRNNIIWLPGLKKTNFDKSKTEKYDIIIEYV